MPIAVPKGVDVSINDEQISVKGTLGTLVRTANPLVSVKNEDGKLSFVPADESAAADAMSGTMRALVANMVNGVSKGFERKLTLVGVGFRAQAQGQKLNLQIGFSHPVARTCRPASRCARRRRPRSSSRAPTAGGGQIAAEVRASVRPSLTRARASATR
jgi:large subunit ribosomal protein L6